MPVPIANPGLSTELLPLGLDLQKMLVIMGT